MLDLVDMKSSYLYHILFFIVVLVMVQGCSLAPDFDDRPAIEFVSFSDVELNQFSDGINADSILLTIYFEDGDGDITSENDVTPDLYIFDNRTGDIADRFKLPTLPTQGSKKGISGEITVKLFSTCCIYPDVPPCEVTSQYPNNQLSYKVVLADRSGKSSDTLLTPSINLICN